MILKDLHDCPLLTSKKLQRGLRNDSLDYQVHRIPRVTLFLVIFPEGSLIMYTEQRG